MPRYRFPFDCRSSKGIPLRAVLCAVDATFTIRDGADSRRSLSTTPALLINTSTRGACSRISSAPRRTDDRSARSKTTSWTWAWPPSRWTMPATAARPLSAFRAVTMTRAPIPANASAVSSPMPELPPVTTTVLPSMDATCPSSLPMRMRQPSTLPEATLGVEQAPAQRPFSRPHLPSQQVLRAPPGRHRRGIVSLRQEIAGLVGVLRQIEQQRRHDVVGGRELDVLVAWAAPDRERTVAHRDPEDPFGSLAHRVGEAPFVVRRVAPMPGCRLATDERRQRPAIGLQRHVRPEEFADGGQYVH